MMDAGRNAFRHCPDRGGLSASFVRTGPTVMDSTMTRSLILAAFAAFLGVATTGTATFANSVPGDAMAIPMCEVLELAHESSCAELDGLDINVASFATESDDVTGSIAPAGDTEASTSEPVLQ
jgi:hypothetical protein